MAGDVKVFTISATGSLVMGVSRPPVMLTGIDKLVQMVALVLLTNPGRSISSPGKGGGIRSLIGTNIDPEAPEELFADIRLMIERTKDYIIQSQANTTRDASERLKDLTLVDIVLKDDSDQGEIVLAVTNQEQDTGQAIVPVI